MDERLTILVYHIRDTSAEIAEFVATSTRDDLRTDLKLERALVMSLLVVGEMVSRICERYPEFIAELPDLPWQQIRGLRNRIAHGYFELDYDIIWTACVDDVPVLARRLVAKLPHNGS